MTPPCDSVQFCEGSWLDTLTSAPRRPNILVSCGDKDVQSVVTSLSTRCKPPFEVYRTPDRLELPTHRVQTLLAYDLAALTLYQQVRMYDWITLWGSDTQVISVASAPLFPLVQEGRFFESLFYRLNVIHLLAARHRIGDFQ